MNPRGELYDEENIGERLSMRDFMQELAEMELLFHFVMTQKRTF
ncbi:DUF188 domain-containing protein [Halobacteriovorax sp. RT-1-5]